MIEQTKTKEYVLVGGVYDVCGPRKVHEKWSTSCEESYHQHDLCTGEDEGCNEGDEVAPADHSSMSAMSWTRTLSNAIFLPHLLTSHQCLMYFALFRPITQLNNPPHLPRPTYYFSLECSADVILTAIKVYSMRRVFLRIARSPPMPVGFAIHDASTIWW